jgi:hypothetical protein
LLQSTKNGLDYKLWKYETPFEGKLYLGIFYFIFFHYNIFWVIFAMVKVSLSDPGEMSKEYKSMYSIIPFPYADGVNNNLNK